MSVTDVAATPEKPGQWDQAAYSKLQNEREQAIRDGKAPAPAKAAAILPAAEPATDTRPLTRAERRAQNDTLRQLGAEKAKREMLEQQLADLKKTVGEPKPAAAVEEDPEPQRRAFTTDAEYLRATSAWDRRQEAKKTAAEASATQRNEQELNQLREEIASADAKAVEDRKLIPDWDEVKKAAEASEDQPEFDASEHAYLMRLVATSNVKAFVLHHLAKHPEEMEKLLAASGDFEKQFSIFRRLEGRVEAEYSSGKKAEKKEEVKPAVTTEERDSRKARPSESTAPPAGSAPASTVSPTLADGKTMNPQWKESQNQRAMARN